MRAYIRERTAENSKGIRHEGGKVYVYWIQTYSFTRSSTQSYSKISAFFLATWSIMDKRLASLM